MIDWILTFKFNSLLGVVLYWAPLTMCVYGYTVRTFLNYRKDITRREEDRYHPTDTVGDIVGRAIITIIPIGNLWAAAFNVAPEVFGRFFNWLGKVFDQPLVPKRKTMADES